MSALEETNTAPALPDLQSETPVRAFRAKLESIYDVPVKISAVLGKKRMNIADLMALEAGAIIELDRRVGEPIDLYANDKLIARGELVMIDGALGVTMTEIIKDSDLRKGPAS